MPSAGVLQASGEPSGEQTLDASSLVLPTPVGTADKAASLRSASSSLVKEEVRKRALQTVHKVWLPARQAAGVCTS